MSKDDVGRRRRKYRRQEFAEQVKLTELLAQYLDPSFTVSTSLENRPRSAVAGALAKRRGVRSGVPDVLVICHGQATFIEVKSRAGIASKAQAAFRNAVIAAGGRWWLVRSARAALTALARSGVKFRREWAEPALRPYEGPFCEERRLPQAPEIAAQRRAAARLYRARRKLEAPSTSTSRRRTRTSGKPVHYDGRTFPSRIALARYLALVVERSDHAVLMMLQRCNDDADEVVRRYREPQASLREGMRRWWTRRRLAAGEPRRNGHPPKCIAAARTREDGAQLAASETTSA
jgi:hypothetical protein